MRAPAPSRGFGVGFEEEAGRCFFRGFETGKKDKSLFVHKVRRRPTLVVYRMPPRMDNMLRLAQHQKRSCSTCSEVALVFIFTVELARSLTKKSFRFKKSTSVRRGKEKDGREAFDML